MKKRGKTQVVSPTTTAEESNNSMNFCYQKYPQNLVTLLKIEITLLNQP